MTLADAATFADFVDAIRSREGVVEAIGPLAELPSSAVERLERCAQDFERQSALPLNRRRHVGVLVMEATPEEANSVIDFLGKRIGLRVVDIDVRDLRGLSSEDLEARTVTMSEPTAHIVAIRGLGLYTDRRVIEAIEHSDVDVLLIGFATGGASYGAAFRRRFKHRLDL
jgi:hypothetical protein